MLYADYQVIFQAGGDLLEDMRHYLQYSQALGAGQIHSPNQLITNCSDIFMLQLNKKSWNPDVYPRQFLLFFVLRKPNALNRINKKHCSMIV